MSKVVHFYSQTGYMVVDPNDYSYKRCQSKHRFLCDKNMWALRKEGITTTSVDLVTCPKCLTIRIEQNQREIDKMRAKLPEEIYGKIDSSEVNETQTDS